jgi:O-antigen ligase
MKILEKIIEYGIYLFVFLLPWQTRLIFREGNLNGYWEYGTMSIYATEILLWAIFLLAAIWWTAKKLKVKSEKSEITAKSPHPAGDDPEGQKSKFVFAFLCLFVVWSLISFLWADSKSLTLYAWHWLAEGVGFLLVLRAVNFDKKKLAWSFVLAVLVQAGLGIWQFLFQSTFSSKWLGMAMHDPTVPGTFVVETALRRWLRAYGSLPHPNMLAGFLAMAMLLSTWLYQKTEYGLKKLFLPAIFAILSLGLFAAFSKSVIASFLFVLILWWVASFIRGKSGPAKIDLFKFTLIFLAVAIIFGAVFWEPVQTRISGAERLEIKSTTERLNYFGEAWQLIKKHPLVGVGLGNYTLAAHNEINPNLKSWDYQPVHNIYVLVLAELGIIGFLFFLVFILYALYFTFYTFRDGKNLQNIVFGLALCMLLAVGFFDHYLWTLYFGVMIFWLGLGLIKPLDTPLDRS